MADCESCKNWDIIDECMECMTCFNGSNFEEIIVTNADRIRAMTDEELAEFLTNFKNTFGEEYEGEMSCFDWLQSEAQKGE